MIRFLACLSVLIATSPSTADAQQQVGDTQFSVRRGFYDLPFDVVISSSTPGATIRYTLDGSDPRVSTNFAEGGTPVTVRIDPNGTNGGLRVLTPCVTLRAYAYAAGMTATDVDTQTYVFVGNVLTQTRPSGYPTAYPYAMDPNVVNDPRYVNRIRDDLLSIPTVSVVMARDDIFGGTGLLAASAGSIEPEGSFEVIYPDGRESVQENCGYRPHSHVLDKRNFRLYFRAVYGADKLKHDLFSDAVEGTNAGVRVFDRLVLRAGVNDNLQARWNNRNGRASYATDELARASQIAMSGFGSRGLFCHLYLNGLYWGLYNLVERPDEGFTSEYFGGAKADWFAINHGGILGGDPTWFFGLISGANNWSTVRARLDVQAFADYILYYMYSGGGDWPDNNWYAGNRNTPTPGRVRWFVWDCEDSWIRMPGRANDGAWIHPDLLSSTQYIAHVWKRVDDQPDFRIAFADRVYKHCFNDGVLSERAVQDRWDRICSVIDGAVVGESARWGRFKFGGGLWTRDDDWIPYKNSIRNLMVGNVQQLVAALRNTSVPQSHPLYYPNTDAPLFKAGNRVLEVTRASVTPGFRLTIERAGPTGTVYYTLDGSDPRLPGGAAGGTAAGPSVTLTVNGGMIVRARTRDGSEWSALHELALDVTGAPARIEIHEFLAQNNTGIVDEQGQHEDWIELINRGAAPFDLSGHHLTDDLANPTKWTFPAGTVVQAGQTLLIWADNDPGALHASFKLSASGEVVALFAPGGASLLDLRSFGPQQPDVSMGRLATSPSDWFTFPDPTPRRANWPEPAGYLGYGSAAGSLFEMEGDGVPVIGTRASFEIENSIPLSPAFVAIGFSPRVSSLGTLGTMLVDPLAVQLVVTDAEGDARYEIGLPYRSSIRGTVFYAQSLVWSGAAGGMTNALIARIGH